MSDAFAEIRRRMQAAVARSGRETSAVELLAVSKTKPVQQIVELFRSGQKIFAENYVQELIEKKRELDEQGWQGIEFHFIGHLQTNKVKPLLPFVSTIHSVDSLRLYDEIVRQARVLSLKVFIYFQINLDAESSKGGFLPEELAGVSDHVKANFFSGVIPSGLMAIPDPEKDTRLAFRRLKRLSEAHSATLGHGLSMGMSDDFEAAIEEGATSVRIGSALFGARA